MNCFQILLLLLAAIATRAHGLTYDQWKSQVFTVPEVQNAQVSGELADPDKDGINNLLEYAMNGAPQTANPTLMPTPGRSSGALTLQFKRRREALDLDYVVEVSNDLVTWSSGFANVWITDAVPTDTVTVSANQILQVVAETVTATSQVSAGAGSKQFMRLKVIKSPRGGIKTALATANLLPSTLIAQCVIPSGGYVGALSRYPIRSPKHSNYLVEWYFGALGLTFFAESSPAAAKAFVEAYIGHLDAIDSTTSHRIHNFDLWSDEYPFPNPPPAWSLIKKIRSDSDDAYAGSVIRLAAIIKKLNPGDTWFDGIRGTLKDIAYHNILDQAKAEYVYEEINMGLPLYNGSIRVFQDGTSNRSDKDAPNDQLGEFLTNQTHALFMDNVQAWAGLNELVDAYQMVEGNSIEVIYLRNWRDELLRSIHRTFWDSANNAWRVADFTTEVIDAGFPKKRLTESAGTELYPHLILQCYPQLMGMPYPDSTVETQRRYNMAWKWVIDHQPNWMQTEAWPSGPDDDKFSHVEIAVIAAKMGETQKVASFLDMARGRWLPGGTLPDGTVSEQIGYWHLLVGY